MMFSIKKFVLNGVIALFICFIAYGKNNTLDFDGWSVQDLDVTSTSESETITAYESIDLGGWSLDNSTLTSKHECDSTTHTHEVFVTHHEDYDKYVGVCTNNETKECTSEEAYVYNNNLNYSNLESPSHNTNNPDSTTSLHDRDHWNDHLRDQGIDARNEQTNNTQTTPNKSTKLSNSQIAKLNKIASEYNRQAHGSKMYCAAISPKTVTFEINKSSDIIAALKLPTVQERLQHFKEWSQKYGTKKETTFVDKLLSGKIAQLLEQILYADPKTAHSALNELKKLSPYDREYKFLVPLFSSDREEQFIHSVLGEDIIKIAEQDLFARQDYIAHYANEQEQKIIQNYKEKCISLQQKGDIVALHNESKNLCFLIVINNKKNDFTSNACLAIAESTLHNSITTVFSTIRHAQSLEKAHAELMNLEIQILDQTQKINIIHTDKIKQWTIDHYGFDVFGAAQNCYKSRVDYVATSEKQSLFSDNMRTIMDNIEHKDLPRAHAELVHLDTQVDKILKERNITNPIEQKEYIKKSFGKDVLDIAHKTYEARSDHKELVKSFMAIDVNQATMTILENNNSYESVANEMSDLAKHVFANAHHCNLSNLPTIELHVYNSIDAMRTAQDHPTFIFNFSMVHHTLGDIQQLAHAILSGRHPVLERSSELLTRGFDKFFRGLNPITQVSNIGHLASDLGSFLKKGGIALWNDPITTTHNGITTVFTLTELIRNTADFTSDLIVGKLYLSPEEYKQRIDTFCEIMEPLQGVTAEHCTDFVAQVAADVVFFKGLGNAYNFLKEIDVLGKLGKSAAAVARTFKKGFDTHLANNPIVVTAEGITIKISDAMHNINNGGGGKNVINSSKALLESAYAKIAVELKPEIAAIKKTYDHTKDGFAEFSHAKVTMEYEHILGMELDLTKKGKLAIDGFHHDLKNVIEKSNILDFTNRVSYEHGFYKVALFDQGNFVKNATFFPAEWSRDKVISKIYEAYDNFIKSGAIAPEKGGKYIVEGLISEGITIRMFITKNGRIVTAYPKL